MNKESKSGIKNHIYGSIKNLTILYQDYFNTHKLINKALLKRFNLLNDQIEDSSKTDKNIQNSIILFKRIINFSKILKTESKPKEDKKKEELNGLDKEKIIKTYSIYLTKLSEIDKYNKKTKDRLIKRISDVSNSGMSLKYRQKLEILSKMISFSKILINLNDRILTVKKKILNNLKKYSFQNLNELMQLTEHKSKDVDSKFKNLENLKNTLNFVRNTFSTNKDKLSNLKGTIVDNINNVDNKLSDIRNYKEYHNELSKMFKNLAGKTSKAQEETQNIFQEIKTLENR